MADYNEMKNRFRKKIEELINMDEEIKNGPVTYRYRLRLPEPPQLTVKQREIARKRGEEELQLIEKSLGEFYESVSDLAVFRSLLYPHFEEFSEAVLDAEKLVKDDINHFKLTEKGRQKYDEMRKIQRKVLTDLLEKYGEE